MSLPAALPAAPAADVTSGNCGRRRGDVSTPPGSRGEGRAPGSATKCFQVIDMTVRCHESSIDRWARSHLQMGTFPPFDGYVPTARHAAQDIAYSATSVRQRRRLEEET
ncbi:hypothetical protein GCM10010129_40840 [Streptomyces fumigatiscleroticus]|nr:hypothetical protein GCM10010129_40840 [Streptomyces fumigatiscleroticus]